MGNTEKGFTNPLASGSEAGNLSSVLVSKAVFEEIVESFADSATNQHYNHKLGQPFRLGDIQSNID